MKVIFQGLKTKLHDNFDFDLTADCSQTVGRTDFGRTSLEPALKCQYKSLMVEKLRCAFVEQYAKKSIILIFLVNLFHVAWCICT